jgi:hypothetical protein
MVSMRGFYINGNSYPDFTGTSCVAPLYAGLFAVLRSALGRAFGFLNPILYQLPSSVFNDITYGKNDSNDGGNPPFYTAGAGRDACTGLGSIDGTPSCSTPRRPHVRSDLLFPGAKEHLWPGRGQRQRLDFRRFHLFRHIAQRPSVLVGARGLHTLRRREPSAPQGRQRPIARERGDHHGRRGSARIALAER